MRLALLLAGLAIPICATNAQVATPHTTRSLIVGPTVTASVDITLRASPDSAALTPWQHRAPPLSPDSPAAAELWTDLPIRLGALDVAPGRYLLWIDTGDTLVLTHWRDGHDGFSSDEVFGRVAMTDSASTMPIPGWALRIVTRRFGPDTVATKEDRSRQMLVIHKSYAPGTRSWLQLRYRGRELVVPVLGT